MEKETHNIEEATTKALSKTNVGTRFFPSFYTKEFPWEAISDDEFICKIDDYTLRVEQMDKGHWWWRVYFKDEPILEKTNEFSSSKYRAIGYCEGLYMGHSLSTLFGFA